MKLTFIAIALGCLIDVCLVGCDAAQEQPAQPSSSAPSIEHAAPLQPELEPLASSQDAIRRFHAVRDAIGLPSDPDERLTANRDLRRNCLAAFKATLRPEEERNCIVFGDVSSLDREGECWVVRVDQGLLGGQIAYFDDMGRLLFAWRAPEG